MPEKNIYLNARNVKILISVCVSLYFISYVNNSGGLVNWNIIDSVDLILHEAGHTIFVFFGEFINILAGSFFQIFIPCVFVVYFFIWRKEYFSASLLLFWVGQNILNVAIYMGDSIKLELPLLGGDGGIHDWNYLLSNTGLLKYTDILSQITFDFGFMVIITASVLSFYLAWYNDEYESIK